MEKVSSVCFKMRYHFLVSVFVFQAIFGLSASQFQDRINKPDLNYEVNEYDYDYTSDEFNKSVLWNHTIAHIEVPSTTPLYDESLFGQESSLNGESKIDPKIDPKIDQLIDPQVVTPVPQEVTEPSPTTLDPGFTDWSQKKSTSKETSSEMPIPWKKPPLPPAPAVSPPVSHPKVPQFNGRLANPVTNGECKEISTVELWINTYLKMDIVAFLAINWVFFLLVFSLLVGCLCKTK